MKQYLPKGIFSLYFIAFSFIAYSQGGVAINKDNTTAHPSAMLDVSSTSAPYHGMLIPRLTTANRNAIVSPAVGLQVFNTDCGVNEYYTGTCWIALNKTIKSPAHITCSGTTDLCANDTRTFSVPVVNGATGYEWTVPAGASITSGQGTTSITVSFGYHSGQVCVRAENNCETSESSCLDMFVNIGAPSAGTISGSATVCANSIASYSINPVSGATAYNWTVPAGATIIAGQNTPSIAVTFGSSSGSVSVTTANSCGTSSPSIFAVTVNALPASTFTPLSGNSNSVITFTPTVTGAAYSWTFASGTPSASTAQNPAVTWSSAGTYSVSLTVTANGCSSTTTNSVSITTVVVQTFSYTGGQQTFTVPSGTTSVKIETWGAAGGNGWSNGSRTNAGKGGYAYGNKAVTPGDVLYINVGGKGVDANNSASVSGGFNGGGQGGYYGVQYAGAGGGGASDVRIGGTAFSDRIIVGGGGGGGSDGGALGNNGGNGGYGGYPNGGTGVIGDRPNTIAYGGTQSAGGAGGATGANGGAGATGTFGAGGNAGSGNTCAGGGGGGYYGGGGGSDCFGGGGGGGSSYFGGMDSGTTGFTNDTRSGHGQVVITY